MSSIVKKILKRLAKKTIKTYRPKIIGITGSVGKTSTREAVDAAIGDRYRVRVASENYNNEYGVPLTILGEDPQGNSLIGWLGVLFRGWRLTFGGDSNYPEVLVIEYGVDKKGDMMYLTQIAKPHIAVMTAVTQAHTEFFGTIEDVAEEKVGLIRALPDDGVAILNAEDGRVLAMKNVVQGGVVTFGLGTNADVFVDQIRLDVHNDGSFVAGETISTLRAEIQTHNEKAEMTLRNIVGDAHMRSIVAGIATALQLGISLADAAKNVASYKPMPGRMKLLGGIKRTLLMDDSYNASPASVHAALEVAASIPLVGEGRRLIVLGEMLELGRYAQTAHEDVGKHIASLPIDLLVTVGEQARDISRAALEAGFPQDRVFTYSRSPEAGKFIQKQMSQGDIILIKGSQGSRMEKVTKEIMSDPSHASELLVRQTKKWLSL